MAILYLLEYVAIGLVLLLMFTQVIWPAVLGRRLFPLFRRQADLESNLSRVNQDLAEAKLERTIEEQKQALEKLRRDAAANRQGSEDPPESQRK